MCIRDSAALQHMQDPDDDWSQLLDAPLLADDDWSQLLDAPLLAAAEKYAFALTGGPATSPAADDGHGDGEWNWSRNIRYAARNVNVPTSIKQMQILVRNAVSCRAIGTRHSFSLVADCAGTLIRPPVTDHVVIDPQSSTVSCSAGLTFAVLAQRLQEAAWALHLSLIHI